MKQLFKKPSYYLISSAMDGNEKAIEKLLAFYDLIIIFFSIKLFLDFLNCYWINGINHGIIGLLFPFVLKCHIIKKFEKNF